jgi:dTDP-4-dehydrorhamnose 3,5-epimerase
MVATVPTRLDGPILLEPRITSDDRGFFVETYRRDPYRDIGVRGDFVQDNHSRSGRGTVRALHFQADPGQPKLVRVARGRVFDVVLDLRRSSSTFGEWESFDLDDERHRQLYVPIGFAHGFCVVSDVADVVYKVGSYYDASTERGIAWDDPDLAIAWPADAAIVSERDRRNPTLAEIRASLPEW